LSDQTTEEVKEEIQYQTIAEFLESTPPNELIHISDLSQYRTSDFYDEMRTPEIQLHCDHEDCNGIRFFRCVSGKGRALELESEDFRYFYVTYRCSNCQRVQKTFSLAAKIYKIGSPQGESYKFGELPTYGPPCHLN
jgi:hypothetical protein